MLHHSKGYYYVLYVYGRRVLYIFVLYSSFLLFFVLRSTFFCHPENPFSDRCWWCCGGYFFYLINQVDNDKNFSPFIHCSYLVQYRHEYKCTDNIVCSTYAKNGKLFTSNTDECMHSMVIMKRKILCKCNVHSRRVNYEKKPIHSDWFHIL